MKNVTTASEVSGWFTGWGRWVVRVVLLSGMVATALAIYFVAVHLPAPIMAGPKAEGLSGRSHAEGR
jgi:hypothetical protein